jgi:hypothetical protein
VAVDVSSVGGAVERVGASYHRYDHLPGGWLMVPTPEAFEGRVGPLRLAGSLEGRPFALDVPAP